MTSPKSRTVAKKPTRAPYRTQLFCKRCPYPAVDGSFCEEHRVKNALRRKKAYAKRVRAGRCGQCGGVRAEGSKHCESCIAKQVLYREKAARLGPNKPPGESCSWCDEPGHKVTTCIWPVVVRACKLCRGTKRKICPHYARPT
mgnify:CR=1 FL=1